LRELFADLLETRHSANGIDGGLVISLIVADQNWPNGQALGGDEGSVRNGSSTPTAGDSDAPLRASRVGISFGADQEVAMDVDFARSHILESEGVKGES